MLGTLSYKQMEGLGEMLIMDSYVEGLVVIVMVQEEVEVVDLLASPTIQYLLFLAQLFQVEIQV